MYKLVKLPVIGSPVTGSVTTTCFLVKSSQIISSYPPGIWPGPLSRLALSLICRQVPEIPASWTNVTEAKPRLSVRYPFPSSPEKLVGCEMLPNGPPRTVKVIGTLLSSLV